jgi:hypothetical protein
MENNPIFVTGKRSAAASAPAKSHGEGLASERVSLEFLRKYSSPKPLRGTQVPQKVKPKRSRKKK